MALHHNWDVKNDFAYVLQFFSLISESLGSVNQSERVIQNPSLGSIKFLEEIFTWQVTWQARYSIWILVYTMYIPSILANILWEKIVNNNSRVRGHVTSLRICLRVANAIFYERTIPELRNLCCHFVKLRFWTILILCTLW